MVAKNSTFHLVIEKYDKLNSKTISDLDLVTYLRSNEDTYTYWVFILHDKDVNELGELEREHYHLVIKCNNVMAKKTVINDIAKTLLVNVNCISCRPVINMVKSVEYLVHKNDDLKYQYDLLDLYSNDNNETLNIIIEGKSQYDIDIDNLINLVNKSRSLTQVYTCIGLSKARTYRSIIVDLWKDKKRYES